MSIAPNLRIYLKIGILRDTIERVIERSGTTMLEFFQDHHSCFMSHLYNTL